MAAIAKYDPSKDLATQGLGDYKGLCIRDATPGLVKQTLTPSVMSVAVFGHLAYFAPSVEDDFAVGNKGQTFNYIKNPESFRACLMQICDETYTAFNSAHIEMQNIEIQSEQVQKLLKDLENKLPTCSKKYISVSMKKIQRRVTGCSEVAAATIKCFESVENVIKELSTESLKTQKRTSQAKEKKTQLLKDEQKMKEDRQRIATLLDAEAEKGGKNEKELDQLMKEQRGFWGQFKYHALGGHRETEHVKEKVAESQRRQRELSKTLADNSEKMTNLLGELGDLEVTGMNFDTVLDTLEKCLSSLEQVKSQWALMVTFFKEVHLVMDKVVKGGYDDMKDTCNQLEEDELKEVLTDDIETSMKGAEQLRMVASVYAQVSKDRLLGNVVRLGELIASVHKGEKSIVDAKRNELNQKCISDMNALHVATE